MKCKHGITVDDSWGESPCMACRKEGLLYFANLPDWKMFFQSVSYFFNFRFAISLIVFVWIIQRWFKIGDFKRNGYFHKNGALPDDYFT